MAEPKSDHIIAAGAICGFIGVVAGAFAAHGLEARLDAHMLEVFRTGATYQIYHALALVLYGLYSRARESAPAWPAWAFGTGIVLFSGSLYALSLTGIKALGMITPLGGLGFLAGWAGFAMAALARKH